MTIASPYIKGVIAMTARNIPSALQNFSAMPDCGYVRQPVVQALFACSSASVWRGVKAGRIPKPKKLSPNITAWNVQELREALKAVSGLTN